MAALFSGAIFVASKLVSYVTGVNQKNAEKESPYECGFEPFEDARLKFDVRFYLIAILFIVLDLEVAFLFPWAVAFRYVGWYGFLAMGVFLLLLLVGFAYEWKKGALEWE
ncbi:MAG: NADH-quinone oxidoreductase subunit A [Gammaproteobacteria bacterium]|nr:NADH-quinone oxidoreductase subunit A [Gammaproteobacteria bacterium]